MDAKEFEKLKKQWQDETCLSSSHVVICNSPNYLKIVEAGKSALPFIFNDLRINGPEHWFSALQKITNANPVAIENHGNLKKMTEDWLKWAEENGYGK